MSLEGPQCAGVGLTPSGLAAITTTLLAVLKAGDHLLVTDNVYVIPFDCDGYRTATKWSPGGPTLRLHIGPENLDDLKADLERGSAALKAAA